MTDGTTAAALGREEELSRLRGFLERVPRGSSSLVLMGQSGIGKSVLWQAGTALAQERGWPVLSAQPSWAEAPLVFSALTDLFGGVEGEALEALPTVQRRALEVALLRADPGEAAVDARTLSSAVLSLLRELGSAKPVMVAVDDVQWLDGPTASCLNFAFRRLGALPVAFLAAARTGPGRLRAVEALPHGATEVLEVGPLPGTVIEEIVTRATSGVLQRRLAVRIARQSGGNPFYALEVARELTRPDRAAGFGDAGSGPLPVPGELRELLKARLEALPARTREALLAAACLENPRASMVDRDALGRAEEAGLVELEMSGRIRFTHPLVASAVYDSASGNRRRAAHRALVDRTADPEERARHLALGADQPDLGIASQLDDAAKIAHARGSPQAAAELVELALKLTPGGDERGRCERTLSGAAFHFEAAELKRAQELLEDLLQRAHDGPLRAQALRASAQLRFRTGNMSQAAELVSEALEFAAPDLGLSASLELDLTFFLAMQGNFPAAVPHIEAAIVLAQRHGLRPVEAEALATRTMFLFLSGHGLAEDDLQRALSLEDRTRVTPGMLRPSLIAGQLVLWTRSADEAAAMFEAQQLEASEQGRESDVSPLGSYLAWALLWKGDVARAQLVAAGSVQLARQLGDPFSISLALFVSALARSYVGDGIGAREHAGDAIRRSVELNSQILAVLASWALGSLEVSLGNYAAAEAVLGPLSSVMGDLGSVDPVLALFVPDEVEALVQLGELERASSLLENFERKARAVGRDWAISMAERCRALVLAARGDVQGAFDVLERAVRSPVGRELGIERARSLLELGRLERRLKQKRAAKATLAEAVASFESLGAKVWSERARAELSRVGSRTAPSELTATERTIARLAAEGLTNHAIALRCFVSLKAVEANLGRAYRKLRITSRAQLGRALEEANGSDEGVAKTIS